VATQGRHVLCWPPLDCRVATLLAMTGVCGRQPWLARAASASRSSFRADPAELPTQ